MGAHRLSLVALLSLSGCCLQSGAADSGASSSTGSGTTGGGDLCAGVKCPGPTCFDWAAPGACDPSDGQCKCYPGGPPCERGDRCDPYGSCVDFRELCGLSCPPCYPDTVCSPVDAQCHCGTFDGPICVGGTCRLYFADSGALVPPGADIGNAPIFGLCTGTDDPCRDVRCGAFEVCDPDSQGLCECGGLPDCTYAEQTCLAVVDGGRPECLKLCEPSGEPCSLRQPMDASVPLPQGCYYFPVLQRTVCAPSTGTLTAGQPCRLPTDCAPGLTCAEGVTDGGKDSQSICVPYCDEFPPGTIEGASPFRDGGSHPCPSGSVCVAPTHSWFIGICESQ